MIELGWDGQRIRETLAGIYRAGDRRLLDEFLTRRACGGSSSSDTSCEGGLKQFRPTKAVNRTTPGFTIVTQKLTLSIHEENPRR